MRAFIGIKLDECLQEIVDIQEEFREVNNNANFSLKNNIHLTLAFLGEINVKQVNEVKGILNDIKINSFMLKINKIKNMRDMIILEVEQNDNLLRLQSIIESELIEKGFNLEKRKFYPHITLIRKINMNINREIDLKSRISECILFSSERINNILTYTPVYKVDLKG